MTGYGGYPYSDDYVGYHYNHHHHHHHQHVRYSL
jgi:hypothetical protein